MNAFLKLITAWHMRSRLRGCGQAPIFAFDTRFFDKYFSGGWNGVKRWGRKAKCVKGDIFELEILIIVANPNGTVRTCEGGWEWRTDLSRT